MKSKKKLGEILVEQGFLKKEDLDKVLAEHGAKKLGETLLQLNLLKESDLVRALAEQCELPFLEKLPEHPDSEMRKMVPMEFMERYQLVPIALENGRLRCATTNPLSLLFIDNLKQSLHLEIDLAFTLPEELNRLLRYFDRVRMHFSEVPAGDIMRREEEEGDGALIRMVRHIILEAVRKNASDIHLEVFRENFAVRYRIDGLLTPCEAPSREFSSQIISRLIQEVLGSSLTKKICRKGMCDNGYYTVQFVGQ